MNYISLILDFLGKAPLVILSITTIIDLLCRFGLFPQNWIKRLKLGHAQDTLEVIKELGVDVDLYRRRNATINIPYFYSGKNLEKETLKMLNDIKIHKKVSVGRVQSTNLPYYIDLIGHSCNQQTAEAYARLLSSYWKYMIDHTPDVKNPRIDFVCTPKNGSPILGYEFAKILQVPFVLHEDSERFRSSVDDMRKKFDCASVPYPGSIALIVDDSTTGGRMVLDTIDDLKKYNYTVTECLVVFEPQAKNARKKLNDKHVNLLSITKTHTAEEKPHILPR